MARKIIIDTDPGQDDAVAILLALASPELDVLGLSVVAGNVPLALTELNARKICELAGRADLPVYAGCDAPISRRLVTAEHVHGKTGLDGITLPAPQMQARPGHAVDFLIETLPRAIFAARLAPAGTPILTDDDMPAQHYQALRLILLLMPPERYLYFCRKKSPKGSISSRRSRNGASRMGMMFNR